MPYLYAALFLMLMNLIGPFSSYSKMVSAGRPSLRLFVQSLAALGFGLAFVLPILSDIQKIGGTNWIVYASLVLGIVSVAYFIHDLLQLFKSDNQSSKSTLYIGGRVLAVIFGLFVSWTTLDHFLFFAAPKDTTGIAAIGEFGVKDIQCEGYAIVKMEESEVVYRCPTTIMLGQWSDKPFVPWPSYFEGRSQELKGAIDAMWANATKAGAIPK